MKYFIIWLLLFSLFIFSACGGFANESQNGSNSSEKRAESGDEQNDVATERPITDGGSITDEKPITNDKPSSEETQIDSADETKEPEGDENDNEMNGSDADTTEEKTTVDEPEIDSKPTEIYTVTFVEWDGEIINSQKVKRGEAAIAPEPTERIGYLFNGWNYDFSNITRDLTVTARYTLIVNPTFVVDKVEAVKGADNVEVRISLVNNPGISSIGMYVTYADGLKLNSVTYNSDIGGQAVPPSKNESPVKLTWVNAFEDVGEDWTFVTLNFSVGNDANGVQPIYITYEADDVYNLDESNVGFLISNGSVSVK